MSALVGLAAAAGRGHPGRRPVLAEHLAQHPGPLPRRDARAGAVEGGGHQVRVGAGGLAQRVEGLVARPPGRARPATS